MVAMAVNGFLCIVAVLFVVGLFPTYAYAATFNDAANGSWSIGVTWGGACTVNCVEGVDYPGTNDIAEIDSNTGSSYYRSNRHRHQNICRRVQYWWT